MAQPRSHDSPLDSSDRRHYGYSFEGGGRRTGREISEKENPRTNPERLNFKPKPSGTIRCIYMMDERIGLHEK